jgi:glutathione peroxidase
MKGASIMPNTIYDFAVQTIEGRPRSMGEYRGKVLLIVNVASRCGLTPQYEGLERLHETYGSKGLAVLGFPANEFGGQEPGTNDEIKQFCSTRYSVTFDMFSKVKVKGPGMDPLFEYLTDPASNAGFAGDIQWNFNKFLVGKDGRVLARFEPSVDPSSAEVQRAVEEALAA